jgi:Cdc6-like AAA superfamily ATPase
MSLFTTEPGQSGLGFAASLTDAYKPQSIAEFVGLEKQKKILSNLAANPRQCALLFQGAPGTGKTSMAFAFAESIQGEVHHIGSQEATIETVKSTVQTCNYVPMAGRKFHVIIMDEADRMSPAVQLYLLSKLDGSEPVPCTIWILTCNAVDTFQDRFLSRLLQLPKFNGYGSGDGIRTLLGRIWSERAGAAPLPDLSSVPTSNVREALQWLEVQLLSA